VGEVVSEPKSPGSIPNNNNNIKLSSKKASRSKGRITGATTVPGTGDNMISHNSSPKGNLNNSLKVSPTQKSREDLSDIQKAQRDT